MEHPTRRDLWQGQEEALHDQEVGGQKVNASDDDQRYLIESEKSGNEAAPKPDSLSKA